MTGLVIAAIMLGVFVFAGGLCALVTRSHEIEQVLAAAFGMDAGDDQ